MKNVNAVLLAVIGVAMVTVLVMPRNDLNQAHVIKSVSSGLGNSIGKMLGK